MHTDLKSLYQLLCYSQVNGSRMVLFVCLVVAGEGCHRPIDDPVRCIILFDVLHQRREHEGLLKALGRLKPAGFCAREANCFYLFSLHTFISSCLAGVLLYICMACSYSM